MFNRNNDKSSLATKQDQTLVGKEEDEIKSFKSNASLAPLHETMTTSTLVSSPSVTQSVSASLMSASTSTASQSRLNRNQIFNYKVEGWLNLNKSFNDYTYYLADQEYRNFHANKLKPPSQANTFIDYTFTSDIAKRLFSKQQHANESNAAMNNNNRASTMRQKSKNGDNDDDDDDEMNDADDNESTTSSSSSSSSDISNYSDDSLTNNFAKQVRLHNMKKKQEQKRSIEEMKFKERVKKFNHFRFVDKADYEYIGELKRRNTFREHEINPGEIVETNKEYICYLNKFYQLVIHTPPSLNFYCCCFELLIISGYTV